MLECRLNVEPWMYITTMRVLSAFTLSVDLFGIFCIVAKTPPVMKQYSQLLLVYQICATVTDTFLNMISIPVLLVPFPIFYYAGLLLPRVTMNYSYWHMVWACLVVTTMCSVVQLFVFRYLSIRPMDNMSRVLGKCLYATCFVLLIVFNSAVVAGVFTMPNRIEELKPIFAQEFSCIRDSIDIPGAQYVSLKDYRRLTSVNVVGASTVAVAISILIYLTFRCIRRTNVSHKTIEMQRKYQISLILQVNLLVLC
ncbi:7TM chemoreceptor [Cooperia oncophora]